MLVHEGGLGAQEVVDKLAEAGVGGLVTTAGGHHASGHAPVPLIVPVAGQHVFNTSREKMVVLTLIEQKMVTFD